MGNTITIKDVELFCTGVHNKDSYSQQDLEGMISAANEVGFTPPVKLGHMADADQTALLKAEALPAFGWVKNIRLKGEKLVGDLHEVPRRVADLIRNGAYKRLSAEIYWNFVQNGKTWPRVLKAISLLGAEIPAVTSLKDVEALYGMAAYAVDLPPGEVKTYQGEIMVMPGPSAGAPLQKDKFAVDYRQADDEMERCGTCRFYFGAAQPGSVGSCGIVGGEIASDAVCDLHEVREAFDFGPTNGGGDLEGYTVEERDGKFYVMDGETELSEHTTQEEAEAEITSLTETRDSLARKAEQYTAENGWTEIRLSRETIGKACPNCAAQMIKDNLRELKLYYHPERKEYAGFSQGLCDAFAPAAGFRTRCMASDAGKAAEDAGAFCNALKAFCYGDVTAGDTKKASAEEYAGTSEGARKGWLKRPRKHVASELGERGFLLDTSSVSGDSANYVKDKHVVNVRWDKEGNVIAVSHHKGAGWKNGPGFSDVTDEKKTTEGAGTIEYAGDEPYVQERDGQHCVMQGRKSIKCFPTKDEAAAHIKDLMAEKQAADRQKAVDVALQQYTIEETQAGDYRVLHGKKLLGWYPTKTVAEEAAVKAHDATGRDLHTDQPQAEAGNPGIVEVHKHTIVKRGAQWCVTTKDGGKTLGCHDTEAEAQAQLGAVEASKAEHAVSDEGVEQVTYSLEEREGRHHVLDSTGTSLAEFATAAEAAEYVASKKAWSGDKASYTVEQLLNAVPNAIAAWARKKATDEKREVIKDDLKLPYKDPDGTVNYNGVRAALAAAGGARTGTAPDLPTEVLAAAKKELEDVLAKGNKQAEKHTTTTESAGESGSNLGRMPDEDTTMEMTMDVAIKRIAQLEAQVADLKQYAEANSCLQAELSAANDRIETLQRESMDREDAEFLRKLVDQGKMLPKEVPGQLALLGSARGKTHRYTKDGEVRERPQRNVIVDSLNARPKILDYSEVSLGTGSSEDFGSEEDAADELDRRVKQYQGEHPNTDYETAYRAVLRQRPTLARRYANR